MAINQHKSMAMGKGLGQGEAPGKGQQPSSRYARGGRVRGDNDGDRDRGRRDTDMKKPQGGLKKAPCGY